MQLSFEKKGIQKMTSMLIHIHGLWGGGEA